MPDGPQTPASRGLRIVAITADADFEQSLRATFGRSAPMDRSRVIVEKPASSWVEAKVMTNP